MSPSSPDDRVRCIACGRVYALPARGAPGRAECPKCGAVSWIALALPRGRPDLHAGRKFRS